MEGPTPVSALIHAATMVTAGVYMVSRSHVIFERAPMALMVVAVIGTLTALFAATIGIAQTDIKKVLAYSTVSQLGYMFMACGVGAFSAGVFHLMTHAFFKGLLFLAAGSVIHAVGGEQDMRKMGGLRSYIPWTFLTMGIATLAIAGIPPFAGFWSKDEILWKAFSSEHGSWVFWLVGVITAFITSFYMFRLLFMTFFGDYRGTQVDAHGHSTSTHGDDGHGHGEPHESPMVMLVPLMILALLSVVGGLVGIGNRFEHFLEPVFGSGATEAVGEAASHSTELLLMGISVRSRYWGSWLAYRALCEQALLAAENRRRSRRAIPSRGQQVLRRRTLREAVRQAADGRVDQHFVARGRPQGDRRYGEQCRRRRAPCFGRSSPHAVGKPALVRRLDCRRLGRGDCLHDLDGSAMSTDSSSPYILTLVTFAPLAGALLLMLFPRRDRDIRIFALVISLLTFCTLAASCRFTSTAG